MRSSGHVPTKFEILMRKGCDYTEIFTVPEDDPLPEDTEVMFYVYPRDSDDVLAFWPAVSVLPGGAQVQITADDHAVIPDGAKFTLTMKKPGFPKTPWAEGRIGKASR